MPETQMSRERRVHERFKAMDGGVVLAARNFGSVINISKGGMALRYINWDDTRSRDGRMDVMMEGNAVINDVPYSEIPDSETYEMGQSRMVVMKQRRIQFGVLTPAQKSQLEHYIRNYTFGEA